MLLVMLQDTVWLAADPGTPHHWPSYFSSIFCLYPSGLLQVFIQFILFTYVRISI